MVMPTGAPKRTRSQRRDGIQGQNPFSVTEWNPRFPSSGEASGKKRSHSFLAHGGVRGDRFVLSSNRPLLSCSYSRFVVAAPLTSLLLITCALACLLDPTPSRPPSPWTSRPKFEASNTDCMKLGDGQVLILIVLTAFSRSEDFVIYVSLVRPASNK